MSYRDDLKIYKEKRAKIKKTVVMAAKITVVALAAVLVLTTVMVIVDMASGGQDAVIYDDNSTSSKTKAPTITVPTADGKLYVYEGETVSWRNLVNIPEGCTISVDNTGVNLNKAGVYEVKYTVTNSAGKSTILNVTVIVTEKEYSYSMLMSIIEKKSSTLGITKSMTKREQVEKIYEYANNIPYNKTGSNIPDIDRENWEKDWIREAIITFYENKGDCYSYYSVSKAFFEYFDIKNVGIQRDNSNIPSKEGTHFWSVVNIGTSTDEWYYYDATRLNGTFSIDNSKNGCLMTLEKIQSYEPSYSLSYDFYTFDPTDYPTVSTKELS